MSQSLMVDFQHTFEDTGRSVKVCADVIARDSFLTWIATFHMAPKVFEMTGCVCKADDESARHAVIWSIGQALDVRRFD
ncbi:hypothetical protein ACFJIX_20555 [Roseateles sp. UC29_93]|uniref:hypothetical protein n=1 Tax=Roseateles sp. UC29_93 TaxID=3350177 RepID=UPI00366C0C09